MTSGRRGFLAAVLALPLLLGAAAPTHAARLFALVNTGEIFVSTNQGANWTIQATVAVRDAVSLQARLSSSDLLMASASGSIYHSMDAGLSWNVVGAPPVSDLVDMTIQGDGDILILTRSGDVYRSDDVGATFTPLGTLTASNFTSLARRSDGRLFALTRTGEVYLSTDDGVTWVAQSVITTSEAVRIRPNGTTLHVITSTGDVHRSTDSGATWTAVGTLSQVGTVALAVDAGTLVVATREGHVATSPDGTTWTWRGSTNQLALTALDVDTPQVTSVGDPDPPRLNAGLPWPNPALGGVAMSLSFALTDPGVVTLQVLDATGRLVAERPPVGYAVGSNAITWDPGIENSGVYFVRIRTGQGIVATRRWVIAR